MYAETFSSYVKNINRLQKQGEAGKVIKILLRKVQSQFSTDCLVGPNMQLYTDLLEIQKAINEFYREWHAGNPAQNSGIHAANTDWEKVYNDKSYFTEQSSQGGIPPDMLDILWTSLQSTREKLDTPGSDGPTLRDLFHKSLMVPPTLEEWIEMCQHSGKKGKSASINGLTYNMVKNWPLSVIIEVHRLLMIL